MARVVRKRKPPVVAISLAFLFFVAAGFATFYIVKVESEEVNKAKAENVELERDYKIKHAAFESKRVKMIQWAMGELEEGNTCKVIETEESLLRKEKIDVSQGYLDVIRKYRDDKRDETQKKETGRAEKRAKIVEYGENVAENDKIRDGYLGTVRVNADGKPELVAGAIGTKVAAHKAVLESNKTAKETSLQGHHAKMSELVSKFQPIDEQITEKHGNADSVSGQIQSALERVSKIEEIISSLTVKKKSIKNPVDGVIVDVPGDGTCYIDKGLVDGVNEGMTFHVYNSGKDSGEIDVVQVKKEYSVCKILSGKVKLNNKIANTVYSDRVYCFTIVGDFDLSGRGKPKPEGRAEITGAIRKFGGTINGELSILTDLLIIGSQPQKPVEPKHVAKTSPSYIAYIQMKDEFDRFNKYQDLSAGKDRIKHDGLNVPVIDADKFLKLTEFAPKRKR